MELGGLSLPPNYKRVDGVIARLKRYVPSAKTDVGERWMGYRPSTPDSLPVIGGSPHFKNVLFGFGHGHTGLIGGSMTGRLIADLAAGRPPSIDPRPYRVDRF